MISVLHSLKARDTHLNKIQAQFPSTMSLLNITDLCHYARTLSRATTLQQNQRHFLRCNILTPIIIQVIVQVPIPLSKLKFLRKLAVLHQVQAVENVKGRLRIVHDWIFSTRPSYRQPFVVLTFLARVNASFINVCSTLGSAPMSLGT